MRALALSLQAALRSALSAALLAALTACLPTNNFATPNQSSSTTSLGGSSLTGTTAASDGALPPCTQYDVSTPTRAICTSCYSSILSTRCPGKSAFSSCIDPTVVSGYAALINQCITQTTQAGFVCTATCTSGQVLNPQSCTCAAPTSTAGSGTSNIDVGQKDFGPPIMGASPPGNSVVGVPSPNPIAGAPPVCVGTIPIYLSIQNRGDTVFRLNQYGPPLPSPSPPQNSLGTNYITSATQPVSLTTTEISDHPGTNAFTQITFLTGGGSEITGATAITGGRVGNIVTVSGAGSTASSFSDGVAAGGKVGTLATSATWASAGFGASDPDGNVYFSDPLANIVDVICYNPRIAGACQGPGSLGKTCASPYCANVPVGTMVRVAGLTGQSGVPSDGALGFKTRLSSPHGIAVDAFYNVYIADSGNNTIDMVCGNAGAGYCNKVGGAVGKIKQVVAGINNYPYGVDVTLGTGADANQVNFYIAEYQDNAVNAVCNFSSGNDPCSYFGVSGFTWFRVIGNGSPGFVADGPQAGFIGAAGSARNPTDVKVNINGNLLYTDYRNNLIRAFCVTPGMYDYCQGAKNIGGVNTVAGLAPTNPAAPPIPSDTGEGTPANLASITYPKQLLIGKRYAGDSGKTTAPAAGMANFGDNNILFTESLLSNQIAGGFATPTGIASGKGATSGPVTGIVNMAMGGISTCLLSGSGQISCLGDNSIGELGDPLVAAATVPDPLTSISSLGMNSGSFVGSGTYHACITAGDASEIDCWGKNDSGQLGNNGTVDSKSPVKVTTLPFGPAAPKWTQIVGGDSHTCAIDTNGSDTWSAAQTVNPRAGVNGTTIWCWGDNEFGALGTGAGDSGTSHLYPAVRVSFALDDDGKAGNEQGGIRAAQLASGQTHTCIAYKITGAPVTPSNGNYNISCWGNDSVGQVGQDPANLASTNGLAISPLNVSLPGAPVMTDSWAVAAGGGHSCAWDTDITTGSPLYCWGEDAAGEVGNGSVQTAGQLTPIVVAGVNLEATTSGGTPTGPITPYYANVALGAAHTCVVTFAGATTTDSPIVKCWGDNTYGQLGNDDIPSSTEPLDVIGLPNGIIHGIFAGPAGGNEPITGSNSTCVIMDTVLQNGVPYCWGQNNYSQIGQGASSGETFGNTVRLICGNNTTVGSLPPAQGFCYNTPAATYTPLPSLVGNPPAQGQIYTIAGSRGKYGTLGVGDGANARGGLFSKIGGLAFDLYKNLIVSDGGFTDTSAVPQVGYRLRLIYNYEVGPENGEKYSVTDSNGQSSYWCMRLKPVTDCNSMGICSCVMLPPTDDFDPNFWESIAAGLYCN